MAKKFLLLNGFLIFILSQLISLVVVIVWLNLDQTNYGFGIGIILFMVYLGISLFSCLIGSLVFFKINKKYQSDWLFMSLELIILNLLIPVFLYFIMGVSIRGYYKKQIHNGSILILDPAIDID